MLQLDEIRAGNRVVHRSSGATVMVLEVNNENILLETFPSTLHVTATEISGIPLTESILTKLSFNNTDSNVWNGEGLNIHQAQDGFFYGLRIEKSKAKMQYLHQLQNYVADFYSIFKQERRNLNLSGL